MGSSPTLGANLFANVAQLVEQLTCNQQVEGSSPFISSIYQEGFPSGQRGRTVNPLTASSKVQILLPPPFFFTNSAGVAQW